MRNNTNTHKQGAAGGNRKYGTCSVLCWLLLGAPMFQTALCSGTCWSCRSPRIIQSELALEDCSLFLVIYFSEVLKILLRNEEMFQVHKTVVCNGSSNFVYIVGEESAYNIKQPLNKHLHDPQYFELLFAFENSMSHHKRAPDALLVTDLTREDNLERLLLADDRKKLT